MSGLRIVLGVSGGIAAYKVCTLLRSFTEAGHDVTVVPTPAALRFVGEATWAALSGNPVATDVWSEVHEVPHVRIGQQADLVVVAPATADLLAKAAHGLADDLLTSTLLTARCPVVFAPAMHTEMWQHPATRANVALLRDRGAHIISPASGRLTGADTGPGRLPEPEELFTLCLAVLAVGAHGMVDGSADAPLEEWPEPIPGADVDGPDRTLAGRHVVVTAGGTREPLDPVRYLGNRSSGKQGYALAATAAERGARVTLVSAKTALTPPPGVQVIHVGSAMQMRDAVTLAAAEADVVVMAAAVADFRPKEYAGTKIKKTLDDDSAPVVELERNPDILAGLAADRGCDPRPVLVGFAAETGDETGSVVELARQKLARKGCDVLVANEVGTDKVFGQDVNTVHILFRDGREDRTVGPAPKAVIAAAVWDAVADLWSAGRQP